ASSRAPISYGATGARRAVDLPFRALAVRALGWPTLVGVLVPAPLLLQAASAARRRTAGLRRPARQSVVWPARPGVPGVDVSRTGGCAAQGSRRRALGPEGLAVLTIAVSFPGETLYLRLHTIARPTVRPGRRTSSGRVSPLNRPRAEEAPP